MEIINTALFIEEYNKLAAKFEAIRALPHCNLYPMDSIEVSGNGTELIFRCSESFHGDIEHETYYFTDEGINKPLEEIAVIYLDLHNKIQESKQRKAETLLQQQEAKEREQYLSLKKKYGGKK